MNDQDGTVLVWTQSSVYEIDHQNKQIRRTAGSAPPTPRVGVGWKPFLMVHVEVGAPVEILWRVTQEGVAEMTFTSTVVAVESCDSELPDH